MNTDIAKQWLNASAQTATAKDFDAHMNLISKHVQLFGVPGFEVIDYNHWARQCRHEFAQGLLHKVSYKGLKMITETQTRIMFKTVETLESSDGSTHINGLEVILKKERDNVWRLTQQRILSSEEMAHDGL